MKVSQVVGPFTFEVEGTSVRDVFQQLAAMHDAFNVGPCTTEDGPSYNIKPQKRIVADTQNPKKTYEYFEWVCLDNGARLNMGQNQDGVGLFPKRKDSDGQYLENRGWVKFRKED